MELNVLKIQRSQEPSVNDDSESERSDEEEDEYLYVDDPEEEGRMELDEITGVVDMEETEDGHFVEITPEVVDDGGEKEKKDARSYKKKPLEEFIPIETESHPDPAPEIQFKRSGVGRNSIKIFRDK